MYTSATPSTKRLIVEKALMSKQVVVRSTYNLELSGLLIETFSKHGTKETDSLLDGVWPVGLRVVRFYAEEVYSLE